MAKKTRKILAYDSMSLSMMFRSFFVLFLCAVCLSGGLKVISIYAQEQVETPVVLTEESEASVQLTSTETPPDSTTVSSDASQNPPISDIPELPPESSPDSLSPNSSSSANTPTDTPALSETSAVTEIDPEVAMIQLIDEILEEAEKDEERPEKDPDDNTDEDPDVDLQDPSLESEEPAPELEPIVPVIQVDDEEISESTDASASLISLLDGDTDIIPLLTRTISEEISTDISAKHSCRLEKFRADVSESSGLKMRVKFLAGLKGDYEAEIGSLPTGIDVVFAQNREYLYTLASRDVVLDLEIINQTGSFDGDFSIPIIYRKKGEQDSSVICQMNLLNESSEGGE